MQGKPSRKERGKRRKRKQKASTEEAPERRKQEERERKNRGLSSQNRNGQRMSCSGSEREKAEKKGTQGPGRRQALVEQLWERSEEGRKETNREPSTRTWKEGTRDQAGEKGESEEAKAEARTGEATVRRNREERERKKQKAE